MFRILWVLVVIAACGKGSEPRSKAQLLVRVEKVPPSLRGLAHLELAGVKGETNQPSNGYGGDSLWLPVSAPPAAGTVVKVIYPTPCGEKTIDVAIPDGLKPYNNRIELDFPAEVPLPVMTRVMLDPELTEPVTIGTVTVPAQPKPPRGSDPEVPAGPPDSIKLLDIACAKEASIGATKVPLPERTEPPPKAKDTRATENSKFYADDAIFLTHRPQECFYDQTIGYGDVASSKGSRLQGASAYRLAHGRYDVWFEPAPKSVEVVRRRNESAGSTALYALDVCPPATP